MRVSHRKLAGFLHSLEILDQPFEQISMDAVTNLPPSLGSRNAMCLNIVDRFSKLVMLIPCKGTIYAQDAPSLFLRWWQTNAHINSPLALSILEILRMACICSPIGQYIYSFVPLQRTHNPFTFLSHSLLHRPPIQQMDWRGSE